MRTFRTFSKTTLIVAASLALATVAAAAQTRSQTDCGRIDAVLDRLGPSVRADELSKKTGMDINSVRKCMEAWKSSASYNAPKPAAVTGRTTNLPSGCTKVAAALDQNGDTLSAD